MDMLMTRLVALPFYDLVLRGGWHGPVRQCLALLARPIPSSARQGLVADRQRAIHAAGQGGRYRGAWCRLLVVQTPMLIFLQESVPHWDVDN